MAILEDAIRWPVNSQETRMQKGNLVRVTWPDGHQSKMYESDAIEQGLLPGAKARPPAENKMRPPAGNKAAPAEEARKGAAAADDLTAIAGVGQAAARLLAGKGITTFAGLRAAKTLDYLPKRAQAAIETWLNA